MTRLVAGPDLYSILGVPCTATQQDIKAAFKRAVFSLHPDLHVQSQVDTTAAFIKCQLAYEVLSDAQRRSSYDQHLNTLASHDTTPSSGVQRQHASTAAAAAAASMATAAAAAAAVNSSGLSAAGLTRHSPCTGLVPQHATRLYSDHTLSSTTSSSNVARTRAMLLEQHDIALEQFSGLQEALDFLQHVDEQCSLLGLASDDYTSTAITTSSSGSSDSGSSSSSKQCSNSNSSNSSSKNPRPPRRRRDHQQPAGSIHQQQQQQQQQQLLHQQQQQLQQEQHHLQQQQGLLQQQQEQLQQQKRQLRGQQQELLDQLQQHPPLPPKLRRSGGRRQRARRRRQAACPSATSSQEELQEVTSDDRVAPPAEGHSPATQHGGSAGQGQQRGGPADQSGVLPSPQVLPSPEVLPSPAASSDSSHGDGSLGDSDFEWEEELWMMEAGGAPDFDSSDADYDLSLVEYETTALDLSDSYWPGGPQ
eukprot:gene6460-biopygen8255